MRYESLSKGDFLPVFLGRDENNIKAWRCIWIARGSLARSRKRARSYSACVRACVRGSGLLSLVHVWAFVRRASLHLSLGWVASPWHTINTGANLPPDEAHGPRWTVGAPEKCVSRNGAKRGQTHTTRRPAAIDVCASRRPVEIIMLAETLAPFGRAPTRRRVLHSGRMTHARLRSPFCGLEAFQISRSLRKRITLVRFRLSGI